MCARNVRSRTEDARIPDTTRPSGMHQRRISSRTRHKSLPDGPSYRARILRRAPPFTGPRRTTLISPSRAACGSVCNRLLLLLADERKMIGPITGKTNRPPPRETKAAQVIGLIPFFSSLSLQVHPNFSSSRPHLGQGFRSLPRSTLAIWHIGQYTPSFGIGIDSLNVDRAEATRYTSPESASRDGSPDDSGSSILAFNGVVVIQSSAPRLSLSSNRSVISNWLNDIGFGSINSILEKKRGHHWEKKRGHH